jgi:hypothetical protein
MKSYGQIAYEAYCRYSDGKSLISGQKLPLWNDQDAKIQAAWNYAAEAVLDSFTETSR